MRTKLPSLTEAGQTVVRETLIDRSSLIAAVAVVTRPDDNPPYWFFPQTPHHLGIQHPSIYRAGTACRSFIRHNQHAVENSNGRLDRLPVIGRNSERDGAEPPISTALVYTVRTSQDHWFITVFKHTILLPHSTRRRR